MSEATPVTPNAGWHIEFRLHRQTGALQIVDDQGQFHVEVQQGVLRWLGALASGAQGVPKELTITRNKGMIGEFLEIERFEFRAQRCSALLELPGGSRQLLCFWVAVTPDMRYQIVGNRADPNNDWKPVRWNPEHEEEDLAGPKFAE